MQLCGPGTTAAGGRDFQKLTADEQAAVNSDCRAYPYTCKTDKTTDALSILLMCWAYLYIASYFWYLGTVRTRARHMQAHARMYPSQHARAARNEYYTACCLRCAHSPVVQAIVKLRTLPRQDHKMANLSVSLGSRAS